MLGKMDHPQSNNITKKHSSRMNTARLETYVLQFQLPPLGVTPKGGRSPNEQV